MPLRASHLTLTPPSQRRRALYDPQLPQHALTAPLFSLRSTSRGSERALTYAASRIATYYHRDRHTERSPSSASTPRRPGTLLGAKGYPIY